MSDCAFCIRRMHSLLLWCLLLVAIPATAKAADQAEVTAELRNRAVAVLRDALVNGQRWEKVHAAECLLALDYPQDVVRVFETELASAGGEAEYRIGIWRVLARGAANEKERNQWIGKIRQAFLDTQGPDRNHAAETLGKLGYEMRSDGDEEFESVAAGDDGPFATNARWVLTNSRRENGPIPLTDSLASNNPATRAGAAYALRHWHQASPEVWADLAAAARTEPANSDARVYLISAAYVYAPTESKGGWRAELLEYAETGSKPQRYEACWALADVGGPDDLPLLTRLLQDAEVDVRTAAAGAILRIGRRTPCRLGLPDWIVMAFYFLGMLAVGWYYARRTKTADDYLLGGRQMKPLMVGLSLFATLLSTISYLTWPGEMIRYGPMMFALIAAYPFVGLVVGWLMIPFIMRLRVTSAYEILQSRFGASVRLLGSFFFLALRLIWMAVIIYATVSKVLVPLLGLDVSATPYLCVLMGLITVAYTSMGGLRAVVLTDVVQTAILFGGAMLTLVLITTKMGGIAAWWPAEWPSHWPEPEFGYNPTARVTFFGAFLATFTWHVCTASSDQMAIQRYLATRNAKTARRALLISLAANACVTALLAVLGLALLACFRTNPHLVPDGRTIMTASDTLFPRFILFGLPAGVSGLVVVALLAAAMSSLSSGINSSCAVITTDFFDLVRRKPTSESDRVKSAKYIAVAVGMVVVVLSSYVGVVKGNLLEVVYKTVNALVAPLFGLFFMAMFVRRATAFGTIIGAVFGLGVVVSINYWEEFTGHKGISFLWAMPMGLIVQVTVGWIASLLPIGPRSKDIGHCEHAGAMS